jgi:hypothetical protein
MHLSKFTVLVAHNGGVDLKEIEQAIDLAIGSKISDERFPVVFEVRGPETTEVALSTIQTALDERLIDRAADFDLDTETAHSG